MTKRLLAGLLFCICFTGFAAWLGYRFLNTPGPSSSYPIRIFIPEGSTLQATAEKLAAEKLITNARFFSLWARATGADRKIQNGEYLFTTALSPLELLRVLIQGKTLRLTVTVVEGATFKQVAALLAAKGLGAEEQFLCLNTDQNFLARWGLPPQGMEGYLYPATYQFFRRASSEEILGRMIERFYAAMSPGLYRSINSSEFDVHEMLTLASLIEKETGTAPERNLVSAVFHNRLRQGMPLQCDSSVIYGISNFNGNLTRQHLVTPSPYNTYLSRGLPLGPIASPSMESILAALNPAQSDYLYFVARGDGTHEFSADLSAHNRAVRRFQKGRS
ncbi:MAG: endolytic transglycosylase MltG [Candidatus Binatia bacterium]